MWAHKHWMSLNALWIERMKNKNEDVVLHFAVDVWTKSHTNTAYFKHKPPGNMKKDTAEDASLGLYAWKHTLHIFSYNIIEKKKYLFNSIILVITSNIQQSVYLVFTVLYNLIGQMPSFCWYADEARCICKPIFVFYYHYHTWFCCNLCNVATKMCNILVHCEAYKIYKRQKHPTVNTSGNFLFVFLLLCCIKTLTFFSF